MIESLDAALEEDGTLRVSHGLPTGKRRRVIITVLEEDPTETKVPRMTIEQANAEEASLRSFGLAAAREGFRRLAEEEEAAGLEPPVFNTSQEDDSSSKEASS